MAKGKHKPAPGAIRPDKVLHPQSRKVKKLHGKEVRKQKVSANATAAGQKLQQLGNFIMIMTGIRKPQLFSIPDYFSN